MRNSLELEIILFVAPRDCAVWQCHPSS